MPRIVVVGMGPAGLVLALRLRALDPRVRYTVDVVELRREYTRKQALSLSQPSWDMLPANVQGTLFADAGACFVLHPGKDERARCYLHAPPKAARALQRVSVTTQALERALFAHVSRLPGVRAHRPAAAKFGSVVVDEQRGRVEARDEHGRVAVSVPYDILIGADGADSAVRREVLRAERVPVAPDAHMYALLLFINDPAASAVYAHVTRGRAQRVERQAQAQHSMRLFRSSAGDMYAGFTVPRRVYDKVRARRRLPTALEAALVRILQRHESPHITAAHIESFSTFPVEPYASSRFAGSDARGRAVFLLGDAALGTHFFTGIGVNMGIAAANRLAQLLVDAEGRVDARPYVQFVEAQRQANAHAVLEVVNMLHIYAEQCAQASVPALRRVAARKTGLAHASSLRRLNKEELCLVAGHNVGSLV